MLNKIKNGTDSIKELLLIYLVSTALVTVLFALFEGHNLYDSAWWAFVTGLTIGYGDIYPVTVAGRVLTVIWANFTVFVLAPLFIGRIVSTMIDNKNEFTDGEQRLMIDAIKRIDKNTKKK